MNYVSFASLTFAQSAILKSFLNKTIDQNYRHRLLDKAGQAEYDSFKRVIADLTLAEQLSNRRLTKIA